MNVEMPPGKDRDNDDGINDTWHDYNKGRDSSNFPKLARVMSKWAKFSTFFRNCILFDVMLFLSRTHKHTHQNKKKHRLRLLWCYCRSGFIPVNDVKHIKTHIERERESLSSSLSLRSLRSTISPTKLSSSWSSLSDIYILTLQFSVIFFPSFPLVCAHHQT